MFNVGSCFFGSPRADDEHDDSAPAPAPPRAAGDRGAKTPRRNVSVSSKRRTGNSGSSQPSPASAHHTSTAQVRGTRDVNGMCARCDKDHDTESCPVFRKPREEHPDAQRRTANAALHTALGDAAGNVKLFFARVVRQPGDGSCLYHSLCYGLGLHAPDSAARLRNELAQWVADNGDVARIADTLVRDWVLWDSNCSCSEYARRMRAGNAWGGALEMAACARAKGVSVHVYERQLGGFAGFKRIASFPCQNAPGGRNSSHRAKELNVLYAGGVHYDALIPANVVWHERL